MSDTKPTTIFSRPTVAAIAATVGLFGGLILGAEVKITDAPSEQARLCRMSTEFELKYAGLKIDTLRVFLSGERKMQRSAGRLEGALVAEINSEQQDTEWVDSLTRTANHSLDNAAQWQKWVEQDLVEMKKQLERASRKCPE